MAQVRPTSGAMNALMFTIGSDYRPRSRCCSVSIRGATRKLLSEDSLDSSGQLKEDEKKLSWTTKRGDKERDSDVSVSITEDIREQMNVQIMRNGTELIRATSEQNVESSLEDIFASARDGDLESLKQHLRAYELQETQQHHRGIAASRKGLADLRDPRSQLPLLHVALMAEQNELVHYLIDQGGQDLTTLSAATSDCRNLTTFYVALAHRNFQALYLIVDSVSDPQMRAALINQVVVQQAPEDKSGVKLQEVIPLLCLLCAPDPHDVYSQEVEDVLMYLIKNGADLDISDSKGNTLLHRFILETAASFNDSPPPPYSLEALRKFLKGPFFDAAGLWWARRQQRVDQSVAAVSTDDHQRNKVQAMKYLLELGNDDNQSALMLAAEIESPLYVDLAQWEAVTCFSDPQLGGTCHYFFRKLRTYDVTRLSSTDYKGRYRCDSVMHIVAHNNVRLSKPSRKAGHVDILDTEPLRSVIREKWKVFSRFYYVAGILHLIHMALFTTTVFKWMPMKEIPFNNETDSYSQYYRPNDTGNETEYDFDRPYHRVPAEYTLFLLLPIIYLLSELADLSVSIRSPRWKFFSAHGNIIYRILLWVFSISTLVKFGLSANAESDFNRNSCAWFLVAIMLSGWIYCLYFMRGIILPRRNIQIGIFPYMLQRIILYDLLPFAATSIFILLAFTAAFHATIVHDSTGSCRECHYGVNLYLMVKYLVGMPNPRDYEDGSYLPSPALPKLLLIFFGLMSTVVLVNMLIAAMNRSFELVRRSRSNPLWRQRLSVLLTIERRLPKCIRRRLLANRQFEVAQNPRTGEHEMFFRVIH